MADSVRVACLCGRNTEIIELASQVPITTITCSCDTCRYTTGALLLSCLPAKSQPRSASSLFKYASTKLVRFFCGHCGSHLFVHHPQDDTWAICKGVVDQDITHLSVYSQHEFVGDTSDGGLAIYLDEIDGKTIPFYLQGPDQTPTELIELTKTLGLNPGAVRSSTAQQHDKLLMQCHCGGVQYSISRPNEASRDCSSPWPDLIVPYHSNDNTNSEDAKWWLRCDSTKFLAGTCSCRSCRLGSGSGIQAWAFVPKVNISQPDGQPLNFQSGTLRQIQSSPGCYRDFCSVCGAVAFWHCEERPDLIDVSVGLLRAPEGSRAENWLCWWTKRVSFHEEANEKPLIDSLSHGLANRSRL